MNTTKVARVLVNTGTFTAVSLAVESVADAMLDRVLPDGFSKIEVSLPKKEKLIKAAKIIGVTVGVAAASALIASAASDAVTGLIWPEFESGDEIQTLEG